MTSSVTGHSPLVIHHPAAAGAGERTSSGSFALALLGLRCCSLRALTSRAPQSPTPPLCTGIGTVSARPLTGAYGFAVLVAGSQLLADALLAKARRQARSQCCCSAALSAPPFRLRDQCRRETLREPDTIGLVAAGRSEPAAGTNQPSWQGSGQSLLGGRCGMQTLWRCESAGRSRRSAPLACCDASAALFSA